MHYMCYMQCMHCMIHTSTSTINPTRRLLKQTDGNLSQVKQQFPVLVINFLSYFQWLKPQKLNEFGAPSFGLQRMLQLLFRWFVCIDDLAIYWGLYQHCFTESHLQLVKALDRYLREYICFYLFCGEWWWILWNTIDYGMKSLKRGGNATFQSFSRCYCHRHIIDV